MSRRVVVTGMAGISPIGQDWKTVSDCLRAGRSGIRRVDLWDDVRGLQHAPGVPGPGLPATRALAAQEAPGHGQGFAAQREHGREGAG